MYALPHHDPDSVFGVPLDFARRKKLHDEIEFDEALADGLVPKHEYELHQLEKEKCA